MSHSSALRLGLEWNTYCFTIARVLILTVLNMQSAVSKSWGVGRCYQHNLKPFRRGVTLFRIALYIIFTSTAEYSFAAGWKLSLLNVTVE